MVFTSATCCSCYSVATTADATAITAISATAACTTAGTSATIMSASYKNAILQRCSGLPLLQQLPVLLLPLLLHTACSGRARSMQ
jgi:hypothetical protein